MGLRDMLLSAASAAVGALAKAAAGQSPSEIGEPAQDPQAIFWDPFAVIDALGYKERPSPVTYETIRAASIRMPIIQAILKTRVDQIANFAYPQEDKFGLGFRVALRDKKASPTRASEKKSQEIQNWLMSTGKVSEGRTVNARDNFESFLRKIVRDSLTYDQATFEIREDRGSRPYDFYAVDAATIRIADTTKLNFSGDPDEVRYVQVYDGLVVAEYQADQLCFGVRNPVTDIRNQGYGFSEVEMLITTITSLLWAWEYNQRYFAQGIGSKGIINFKGTVPERQLASFRRHWYSMVSGVENAFKTPVINADEIQYIDLAKSNRDMEFSAWFDFLIKVASAVYGIDPMEINFKYGDTGSNSMFESSNRQKLAASKDKGLKPLLRFLQNRLSTYLVHRIDEDFEFQFVGLDAQTPEELANLNKNILSSYKTVDEVRAEEDLPPLPDGAGEVILNPVWMQNKTMGAQGQDFGDGEEDDGDFGSELDALTQENPEGEDQEDQKTEDETGREAEKSLRKSATVVYDLEL